MTCLTRCIEWMWRSGWHSCKAADIATWLRTGSGFIRVSMVRVGMRLRSQLVLVLARNRLTRTAAERGFVLSGECGQVSVF